MRRTFKPNKTKTTVDVVTGYARWAESYPAQPHNLLMEVEQQAMLSLIPVNLRDKVCLDLACGSGRYALLLRTRGARQVMAVDYSPHMLAQAQLVAEGRGPGVRGHGPGNKEQGTHKELAIHYSPFSLSRTTFYPLPFADKSFDLITCGMAIGHELDLDRALAEAARVLRPGGLLIYSDFHPFIALAGGQRTFSHHGQTYVLQHYLHRHTDHHRACQAAGLTLEAMLEPAIDGRVDVASHQMPVVLVIKAAKTRTTCFLAPSLSPTSPS